MDDNDKRINSRARAWCFTAFTGNDWKPTNECLRTRISGLQIGHGEPPAFVYFIVQREIAPTTGKRHYQGYVYFDGVKRFQAAKDWIARAFDCEVHIEMAKGSPLQNKDYCSKTETAEPGTIMELGELPAQGKRNDLAMLYERIKDGNSIRTIADEFPSQFIRYSKGIKELTALTQYVPRSPAVDPVVHWWFGPTGVGKSRKAYETFPDAYVKMSGNKWWDGYEGHKHVIFDDYRSNMGPFSELLRVLDRYPHRVEGKGTSCELSANVFVITTTVRPEECWHSRTDEALEQLLRRITNILQFHADGSTTTLKDTLTCYDPLSRDQLNILYPKTDATAMTFKP